MLRGGGFNGHDWREEIALEGLGEPVSKNERRLVVVRLVVVVLLFLLLLAGLAPVGLFAVEVGEDEVKDLRVPAGGVAFNAFFDVLGCCVSIINRNVG